MNTSGKEHSDIQPAVLGPDSDVNCLRAAHLQVRQEAARAESEKAVELFRTLLESAPDAIVIVNDRGRIVLVNSQAERMFDYSRQELLGQPIEALLPERFRNRHTGHRATYADQPTTRPMGIGLDLIARRRDGSEFPVEISLSPMPTEEGLLVTSIVRDITDRKRAEAELRRTDALLKAIVEGSTDAVYVRDREGRYLLINPAGARHLGQPAAEIIGKQLSEMLPDHADEQFEHDREIIESGMPQTFEETLRSWGIIRTYLTTKGPIHDDQGNAIGVFGMSRDITARKREEEKVRQAEARYRAMVEQLPVVTYVASLEELLTTLYISPQLERVLGFTEDDLDDPELWQKQIHPDDREGVLVDFGRTRSTGEPTVSEYRFLTRNGCFRWFRDYRSMLTDDRGRQQLIQGVMLDITAERQE